MRYQSSCFLKDECAPDGTHTKIEARLVAGVHKQAPLPYTQTASPRADTSPIGNCCSQAIMDITVAYLNAVLQKIREAVRMRLAPDIATILVDIDPSARQDMREDGSIIVEHEEALTVRKALE